MLRFSQMERHGAAVCAFSERRDGDCLPPAGVGRAGVCAQLGIAPADLVLARQVHGTRVLRAVATDRGRGGQGWDTALGEADGLVTSVPGLPLAVLVADCVPVALYDPAARAAGLVHAGRRGTLAGVCREAVRAMVGELGCRAADIHALIGPSAGPDRYEVSEEMASEFAREGLPVRGRLLNLWQANVEMLVREGVPRGQVCVSGMCTMSDARFFSHRSCSDGRRNMMVLMV